jgi:E3 ubiquitin-protein ligase Mdm2
MQALGALPIRTTVSLQRAASDMGRFLVAPAETLASSSLTEILSEGPVQQGDEPRLLTARAASMQSLIPYEDGGGNTVQVVAVAQDGGSCFTLTFTEVVPQHQFSQEDFESSPLDTPKAMCIACTVNVANAAFVHGDTAHEVCCLACTLEIQRRGDPCPVCRQPFSHVIRNYSSMTPQVALDDCDPSTAKCSICMESDANASFVHGHIGHEVCCQSCALDIQRRGDLCPDCSQPFSDVIRNYSNRL